MSKIYVNCREIRDANFTLRNLETKAKSVNKQIYRLKSGMSDDINGCNIKQRLEQICHSIDTVEVWFEQLYKTANYCMEQYEAVEYEISRNAEAFL